MSFYINITNIITLKSKFDCDICKIGIKKYNFAQRLVVLIIAVI